MMVEFIWQIKINKSVLGENVAYASKLHLKVPNTIFTLKIHFDRICWSPVAKGDFSVSGETKGPGMSSMSMGFSMASCCGYGSDGMGTKGYDCVIIDGAVKNTNDMKGLGERFCGRQLVSNDMDMATKTICSKYSYIIVTLISKGTFSQKNR